MTQATTLSQEETPPWAAGAAERMHELDPALDDDEIEILRGYGTEKTYSAGNWLWRAGDRGPFMLALDGSIDVIHQSNDEEHVVINQGPRHYIGEIITMSGGRALVSGRARENLRVLVLEPDDLRRLIATEADLGEKLLLSFILRRMRMVAEGLADVTLVGESSWPDAARLQRFLSRNGIPFRTLRPNQDDAEIERRFKKAGVESSDQAIVICNGEALIAPSNRELAEQLGFTAEIDCGVTYDVAVVGSGPAGLAAAVYAASEGLSVVVLESCAPGGQAASSSKIENYMGFPTGISGQALMGRAYLQAQKFGAQIAMARQLLEFECGDPLHKLRIDDNDLIYARAVVLASGAVYRQPDIDGLDGHGSVHYGASHVEGEFCRGQDVAIVGGGNSAGQAAVYLSKRARSVHILIRGSSLSSSMSDYLVQRINQTPNVVLHTHSEVASIEGDKRIDHLVVRDNRDNTISNLDVSHLFIFIGAKPGTDFMEGKIALDGRGFALTGPALEGETLKQFEWPLERQPYLLETSCPRVFAAGDVRSGSVKRVAAAVGEGSVCVQFIHTVLEESH